MQTQVSQNIAGELFPLAKAKAIAMQLQEELTPFCSTIGIVGSIRRNRSFVKDIELCCSPFQEADQLDLFASDSTKRSEKFVQAVSKLGCRLKGNIADGRYVQIFLEEHNIKLDLFMPQAHDFYRQYAIRTGSAAYSARVIALGWVKQGWVGTEYGLRKVTHCTTTDGHTWKWVNRSAPDQLPPAWKSEKEFFDWLKVPFRSPQYREV